MIKFDLDGTLWDSTVPVADSWNVVIEKETGEEDRLTPEDIMGEMGRTMSQIADDLFGDLPEDERYELAHKCEVYENDYIKERYMILSRLNQSCILFSNMIMLTRFGFQVHG